MKPKIICHMMSSVDGRLVGSRWSEPFNGIEKDRLFEPFYEASAELGPRAWMIGRNTILQDFQVGKFDFEKYPPAKEFKTFIGSFDITDTCIVFDSKGEIIYSDDILNSDSVIAILSETVSEEYLSYLREQKISYIFAGPDGYDLHKVLEILNIEFEYNELQLAGGGILNGMFLKAGLIDELSLLIYPGIDGLSGMPSIFEYKGEAEELPAQGQALELLSVKELRDGIVWMRYKFHKISV